MNHVPSVSPPARVSPRRRRSTVRSITQALHPTDAVPQSSSIKLSLRQGRKSQQRNAVSNSSIGLHESHGIEGDPGRELLDLLCVMGYHGVEHFVIPGTARWNKRRGLGEGSSFAVEEASLPLSTAVDSLSHRKPQGRLNHNQNWYFTDHTGIRWKADTRVAFKVPENDRKDLRDIIQEVRILCHPPLQNHPNIVSLLGIAWVRQAKEDSAHTEEGNVQRDRPTVVIAHAPHGSLYDFVTSPAYRDQHVSLKAKLRLCMDVLKAMMVSRT